MVFVQCYNGHTRSFLTEMDLLAPSFLILYHIPKWYRRSKQCPPNITVMWASKHWKSVTPFRHQHSLSLFVSLSLAPFVFITTFGQQHRSLLGYNFGLRASVLVVLSALSAFLPFLFSLHPFVFSLNHFFLIFFFFLKLRFLYIYAHISMPLPLNLVLFSIFDSPFLSPLLTFPFYVKPFVFSSHYLLSLFTPLAFCSFTYMYPSLLPLWLSPSSPLVLSPESLKFRLSLSNVHPFLSLSWPLPSPSPLPLCFPLPPLFLFGPFSREQESQFPVKR